MMGDGKIAEGHINEEEREKKHCTGYLSDKGLKLLIVIKLVGREE